MVRKLVRGFLAWRSSSETLRVVVVTSVKWLVEYLVCGGGSRVLV